MDYDSFYDEACLGAHAMRSICRRTAPFGVPVVAMSCAGWDDPEEPRRSRCLPRRFRRPRDEGEPGLYLD